MQLRDNSPQFLSQHTIGMKMKLITWLIYFYIAAVQDILLVAQEQQECEVGEDGSCRNTEHTKVPIAH
jgi:hypothetical protein